MSGWENNAQASGGRGIVGQVEDPGRGTGDSLVRASPNLDPALIWRSAVILGELQIPPGLWQSKYRDTDYASLSDLLLWACFFSTCLYWGWLGLCSSCGHSVIAIPCTRHGPLTSEQTDLSLCRCSEHPASHSGKTHPG